MNNDIKEFVLWCNENVGFLSAILSIVTILISVIAIIVSLKTALLPYKQALKIIYYIEDNEDDVPEIYLTLMNIGNSPIGIDYIAIEQKQMHGLPLGMLGDGEQPLGPIERMIAPNSISEFVIVLDEYEPKQEENNFVIRVATTKRTYKKRCDWGRG